MTSFAVVFSCIPVKPTFYDQKPLEKAVKQTSNAVLLVCGENDKKGIAEARRLFSLAKKGKLARMKDCDFLPMLEYPNQFARLIEDFTGGLHKTGNKIIPLE